jgi:hypothetical protein
MLISCPKCGFSQPEDRFCAKCGVDIENFKPLHEPPKKSIFSNLFFQICLVLGALAAIFFFIQNANRENMASRVQFLKGKPVIANRTAPGDGAPVSNNPELPPPPPAENLTVPTPQAPAANPAPGPTAADGIKVHIYYAEVDRSTMDTLRQESHSTGQFTEFGDFKAGALPANKKPTRERGVRILERVEKKLDAQHLTEQWFTGSKVDAEHELGITTMINLDAPTGKSLRGEIEVIRSFRESEDISQLPVRRGYPTTTFELNSGMSWMITLNLPQNTQIQARDEGEAGGGEGILRIFQSPQFKSKQTEFTLFIEFEMPGAIGVGKNHEPIVN